MSEDIVQELKDLSVMWPNGVAIRAAQKITELEADVAAWRGIHEGAVLAMQRHIAKLERSLDIALQYVPEHGRDMICDGEGL